MTTGASVQHIYDEGVRARLRLIPAARKVRRDFALLADSVPEGASIMAILDGILRDAERWHDQSYGVGPVKGPHVEPLPEGAKITSEDLSSWAKATSAIYETVARLGTYCHFSLKERRMAAAAQEPVPAAPLLSRDGYALLKRKNTLLNDLEILLGRTSLSSYPHRMELDPTNECNLRCRGCNHGITKDFHHIEMRRDYIDILSESFPFTDYLYPIGTGEPTMSTTIPAMIREAARHQVKVDMLTNGTLLEKATVPWDAFYRLGISIDGASEETMRALRPVAPLAYVLNSLRVLRAKAPQATIYTKVTVSRMNYDELPALMEKLADAGVNEVIVHSLDVFHHTHEALQVRTSDRGHMAQCVEEARTTAERRGMAFVNALNFDGAARHDTVPRDKDGLFQLLKETPLPVLEIRELPEILENLRKFTFAYYPEAVTRTPGFQAPVAKAAPKRPPAVSIETMDSQLQELIQQARQLTSEQVRIPYCFLPWKMPIVDPDGRARACCHLPGRLGDIDQGNHFQDLWSSPGYVQLRDSMFHVDQLPDVCAGCQEFDRSAYSAETLALADFLEVPIRQAPRYPVPMDVSRAVRALPEGSGSKFEVLGASERDGCFVIPPGAQILARFPNPRVAAGVYYQGKFQFSGGELLLGIKPLWANDMWSYRIDPTYASLLGDWVGLPMPPLPLNFSAHDVDECCVFLWAPNSNGSEVEVRVKDFLGVATAAGPSHQNGLQIGHLWFGDTATG